MSLGFRRATHARRNPRRKNFFLDKQGTYSLYLVCCICFIIQKKLKPPKIKRKNGLQTSLRAAPCPSSLTRPNPSLAFPLAFLQDI